MLKKHSQLFESLLLIADLVIITLSWVLSFHIRFQSGLVATPKGIPDFLAYSLLLFPIIAIWAVVFKWFGLYRPKRTDSQAEIFDLVKACAASMLFFIAFTFFAKQYEYSRLVFVFFTVINIAALSVERLLFRKALKLIRRKGYNLRYAVIVGTGAPARMVLDRLESHPEVGIKVEGLISADEAQKGRLVAGVRVVADLDGIRGFIKERRIDIVFIALSWDEHSLVEEAIKGIGDEAVDIKVIPDIARFITLRAGVEEFEGMPILNLQGSPLYGWNMILKRAFDITFSLMAIAFLGPLMLAVLALIKATSPGPALYRQERMGIGGDTFQILKFRTMRPDAEKETGAVWARKGDPRRTVLGAALRGTSLDELPQLFNVLRGDMSLVGPRPERPVFIREFRRDIPRYMLRHRMKAGITGWAQVNGWRGNTDIRKRIEHDLYYIEHWSLAFDLKILFLTLWKGFVNRNAY
ncbi:MAG TPA: undecaprenyl-phosphate glucose phosphotransferase [Deltaproteobacteria bacterium]|nr:MAG: undecaprenyl-phosphate glucose phosphotransferase [Deltaproteobacteria bacterium GWA2_55_82]OGQ63252.1 MAG: undecaprenyl-phosphate glucose phosphotransferase [Deltaproteobacteria bacterium RIFCSPLOWO2_02_FULL_55_12]OIJ73087.1 MAG: undecaprenyl-phosphate glucose phosphotransferase [Deltaproteobacteria bacterium GWC2_55_46]HBG47849.1 undecaprenyl-phosphate glucose phosphotransferase [Deltaproteobacteria bacterium]HCY11888.1 undecaprenyl-phosphate glucose phosphotransferase [Deltaproteobac